MVMESVQIRLPKATVKEIDQLVKAGIYGSRSDAVRDATRKLFWVLQVARTNPKFQIGAPTSDYTSHKLVARKQEQREGAEQKGEGSSENALQDEIEALVSHIAEKTPPE